MQPLIDEKICRQCRLAKPLKDFHPNKTCSKGVVGTCRECVQEYKKKWYAENRQARQQEANTRNQNKKKKAVKHFGNKCHDCLQTFPICCYAFHHLDPTQKDVNPSYAMAGSEERMWEELNKCIMVCANCHMIRHHGEIYL